MALPTRFADKAGALSSVVPAMGCAARFLAIASLGAAIGLRFLTEYENLFLSTLLPLFAAIALFANSIGWFSHRQWLRRVLGMIGPAIVLAAMYPFIGHWWPARLLYTGLATIVGVSIWDLVWSAHRRCGPEGCELPQRP
jgi:mercuric ion transport protein